MFEAIFKVIRRHFQSLNQNEVWISWRWTILLEHFSTFLDYVKSRVHLGLFKVIFYCPLFDNEKPLTKKSITDQEIKTLTKFNCPEIALRIFVQSGLKLNCSVLNLKILNNRFKTLFLWILGFSAISGRARSIVFFGAFDLSMTNMSIREHFQPSVT